MTVAFLRPFVSMFNDTETRSGIQHAIRTGRSWWAVRYSTLDGWAHEWDTEPGSPNGHKDWPLLPRCGRQAVRLYCPHGKFAQLGDSQDATGKLFQFKIGLRHLTLGSHTNGAIETQSVSGHVIGMLTGTNGECILYAWEPLLPPDIPSDAPRAPNEQEWIAKHAEPGLFELAVADWEKRFDEYTRTPQYRLWAKQYQAWESNAHGQLVGPLSDNVYFPMYQNMTALSADVLGIDDGEGR